MHQNARIRPFLTLSIALTLLGITPSVVAAPPSDEQLISKVETLIADRLEEPDAVGFSVVIARDHETILSKGFGKTDTEKEIPVSTKSVFGIGSVTKQFTAAAIMRLVEQGKLSLDDDFNSYLPNFPTQGHTVTIRHLLTHTSGIKSYTAVKDFWKTGASTELSVDELLAYVKDQDFDFPPGEQYKYSNTGYYILGAIVEEASGVPYCQFLREEFFLPLDLSHTSCGSRIETIENAAQGYTYERDQLHTDGHQAMKNYGGAGMIMSNAHDLVAWESALMNGKVVSNESLELMTTPTTLPSGQSTGYGFGLSLGDLAGHRAIMHSGGAPGFSAVLVHFPEENLYIAVNSNVFSDSKPAKSLGREIAKIALGIDKSIADLKPSADNIKQFSGLYILESENREIKIFEKEGYLFMQPIGKTPVKLLYQGHGEFRPTRNTSVMITFDPELDQDFVLHQSGQRVRGINQPILDLDPSPEEIFRFSGKYMIERVNLKVKIIEIDGVLYLQPDGRSPAKLLYQGNGQFRANDDLATKIVFEPKGNRDFVLHQGGGQVSGIRQLDD